MTGVGARACGRPTCRAKAEVALALDGAAATVRLLPLGDDDAPLTLVLCTPHADRLVVPRGWVLLDQRDEGRLFASARRRAGATAKAAAPAAVPDEAPAAPADTSSAEPADAGEPAAAAPAPRAAKPRRRKPRAKAAAAPASEPPVEEPPPAPSDPPADPPVDPLVDAPADAPGADRPLFPQDPAARFGPPLDLPPPERPLLHRAFRAASKPVAERGGGPDQQAGAS